MQVFPFGVVFNRQLTIIYVGRTLQKLFDADTSTPPTSVRPVQSRRSSSSQSHHERATGHGHVTRTRDGTRPGNYRNLEEARATTTVPQRARRPVTISRH